LLPQKFCYFDLQYFICNNGFHLKLIM